MPSNVQALARDFMVKTRRRKGMSDDVSISKYFESSVRRTRRPDARPVVLNLSLSAADAPCPGSTRGGAATSLMSTPTPLALGSTIVKPYLIITGITEKSARLNQPQYSSTLGTSSHAIGNSWNKPQTASRSSPAKTHGMQRRVRQSKPTCPCLPDHAVPVGCGAEECCLLVVSCLASDFLW